MSDPGLIRSDLCSICAAAEQADLARATRSLLAADGHPLADDDPLPPSARGGDRALGTGGAWLVAGHLGRRTGVGR